MAFTATLVKHAISGNERTIIYNVTADAASGSVSTPLGFVDAVSLGPISMATAGGKFKANLSAASAAANGSVLISSVANGDNFFLIVYGKS